MNGSRSGDLSGGLRFIAWSWIVLGIATAVLTWLGAQSVESMRAVLAASGLANLAGLEHLLTQAAGWGRGAALQLVFALACIAGGAGLLARRAWGRSLCVALCWVSLALTAAFAVLWMRLWNNITTALAGGDAGWALLATGLAIDAVITLAAALPQWLFLRKLGSVRTRAAMR